MVSVSEELEVDRLVPSPVRRSLFTSPVIASLLATGASMAAAPPVSAQSRSDPDVLALLLNLAYVSAQFHRRALGMGDLPADLTAGSGTYGPVDGGRPVVFADRELAGQVAEIAADKLGHVRVLRRLLGSGAVAQPRIDLTAATTGAFSALARLAGLVGDASSFDPYADEDAYLLGAFSFEDVAVIGLRGALRNLSGRTEREVIAGMLAATAHHAAAIRAGILFRGGEVLAASDRISDARDKLGRTEADQGVSPLAADEARAGRRAANLAPTNSAGAAFAIEPDQVLNILYLRSGLSDRGGFLPDGANGSIRSSRA